MRKWMWLAGIVVFGAFVYFSFQGFVAGGLAVGDPVPLVTLADLDGNERTSDDWRGQAVVFRFSSVLCAACADDFQLLNEWQEALGDRVRFVAVQAGDTADVVARHLSGRDIDVPVLIDPRGDLAQTLGIRFVPAVAFVTSRGTLSSVSNNEMSRTDMRAHIEQSLAGGPTIDREMKRIASQLRCMECEGRSVWESDAGSSIDMRTEVYELLLAGFRGDEVIRRFEEDYGSWVLMAPPVSGFTSLVWFLPLGALMAGVLVLVVWIRRSRRVVTNDDDGGPPREDHSELVRKVDESLG